MPSKVGTVPPRSFPRYSGHVRRSCPEELSPGFARDRLPAHSVIPTPMEGSCRPQAQRRLVTGKRNIAPPVSRVACRSALRSSRKTGTVPRRSFLRCPGHVRRRRSVGLSPVFRRISRCSAADGSLPMARPATGTLSEQTGPSRRRRRCISRCTSRCSSGTAGRRALSHVSACAFACAFASVSTYASA